MPVTDIAIEKIKGMITSGQLAPGDRLPKEAELAQQLGLSRSSLREAVKALCLIRVLDVRQGDGTYVTSLEPNLLLDAMTFVVDFHRDITELGTLLGELEDSPTVEALVANDLQFHRKIADGSGNPVLCSLLDSLSGPTARARIWRGLTQEGAVVKTREQHTAIYEAIAAREPELARSWATVHVAGVEQWLRNALGTADDP